MSDRFFSLITALCICIGTGLLARIAYLKVAAEEGGVGTTLATLDLGVNLFTLRSTGSDKACHGLITAIVSDTPDQLTIDINTWTAYTYQGQSSFHEVHGNLIFNPLGQLGGSIFHANIKDTPLRIGTLNINPITIRAVTGNAAGTVIFEQNLPGPIELQKANGKYRIIAPRIFSALSASPVLPKLFSQVPYTITSGSVSGCSRERADPIDISHLPMQLQLFKGIAESTIGRFLP